MPQNTPIPNYGYVGDVVNSIPVASAYPGGRSLGMPASTRYRQADFSVSPTKTNNSKYFIVFGVIAIIFLLVKYR